MHHKRGKYLYRYIICLTLGVLGLLFVGEQQAWAQDKNSTPTLKIRRQKKKVKKVNPNRRARSVKDKHRTAPSRSTNFSHKDQYSPPASKKNSGKVKDQYRRPPSLNQSRQVKDDYQSPRSTRKSRRVKDNYQSPRSVRQSEKVKDSYQSPRSIRQSGNVKDTYKPPATISPSEKVRVTDARSLTEPDAEEGKKKSHLPFLDQLFNRHNRYFRQKERYLKNLSLQLNGYQGDVVIRKNQIAPGGSHRDKSVGDFKGTVTIPSRVVQRKSYEKVSSEHEQYTGHVRVLRPYQQKKVNQNNAHYIGGHQGWMRAPTQKAQTRYHKKLASQIHQHSGSIRVKKRKPGENMHPSVHHLARVGKSSYEQKERHRKRRIWITHIFKSKEQPQHLKAKTRKPRYDSKETDIWYY